MQTKGRGLSICAISLLFALLLGSCAASQAQSRTLPSVQPETTEPALVSQDQDEPSPIEPQADALGTPPEDLAAVGSRTSGTIGKDACPGNPSGLAVLQDGFANRGAAWAGGDAMDVVVLPDGRRLWIFGDTFYGDVSSSGALASDARMVPNSAVVQNGACFSPVVAAGGGGWAPGGTVGRWLWPQDALVIGDELAVFLLELKHNPNAAPGLNYTAVGGAIALFDLADLTQPTSLIRDVPTVDGKPFGWGALTRDGYHVINAHHEGVGTYAARIPLGSLTDFAQWEYWNGEAWALDLSQVEPIHELRVRIHEDDNGQLVGLAIPFGSKTLLEFRVDSVVGPFTQVQEHSLDPVWPATEGWAYQPLLIPGSSAAGARALAVNFLPWDPSEILDDIHLYGPRFLPAN